MPEKLCPEPEDGAIAALASRQELLEEPSEEVLAWWEWWEWWWPWWCLDLAEASVIPPPNKTVAAKIASAVRDWVVVPSVDFWYWIILVVPQDSIATYVASGTPVPF